MNAAALEGVAHVAVVVGRKQDKGDPDGRACAQLRNGNLKITEQFQQKGLELRIGLVHFVEQQHNGFGRADGLQKRSRLDETIGKKSIFLRGDGIDRFGKRCRGADDIVDPVFDHLGVEQLLGVFPFIEGFGLVQAFVALETDQLPSQAARHRLGQLRFADARRPFDQNGLLGRLRQKNNRGDFPRRDVACFDQPLFDI
ncbi:MAG: hypothetical protein BWX45_00608 [Deltaproteobacteria bacterium ADurb.Bin002]|nr:MAG: hypothetical protein BWX45_00608 [Deltaproteobacteria bacterium ADurb.Bin002]